MTSRYNLIQQPSALDASITEFVIQDTTDSATEAITEIYLDFSANNSLNLTSIDATLNFADGLMLQWFGEPGSDGNPIPLNTFLDGNSIPKGLIIQKSGGANIFDSIDNTLGAVLFSTSQESYANILNIHGSGYKETSDGAEITFGGDTGGDPTTTPAGPTFTHIANNNGAQSGIDDSSTDYDANANAVRLNIDSGDQTALVANSSAKTAFGNFEYDSVLGTVSFDVYQFGHTTYDGTYSIRFYDSGLANNVVSFVSAEGSPWTSATASGGLMIQKDDSSGTLYTGKMGRVTLDAQPHIDAGRTVDSASGFFAAWNANTGYGNSAEIWTPSASDTDSSWSAYENSPPGFGEDSDTVLSVLSSSLYVDNLDTAGDTADDVTMGIYLDMTTGMSSTLIPYANNVTVPTASEIYDNYSDTLLATFDGTQTYDDGTRLDTNDLPWIISLTDETDIFLGRDFVDRDPGYEVIEATLGNDQIDAGGGYNLASFLTLSEGIVFDMSDGGVNFGENSQQWMGFQDVFGTTHGDTIHGSNVGDDDLFAGEGWTLSFDSVDITSDSGSNMIVSNGGGGYFYGNSGNDIIILNAASNTDGIHESHGGLGSDAISLGLAQDDVSGGGKHLSSNDPDPGVFISELEYEGGSDDFYNDGATFASWTIGEGISGPPPSITINGQTYTVTLPSPGNTSSADRWHQFADEANKQINIALNNLNADGTSIPNTIAYQYIEIVSRDEQAYDESNVAITDTFHEIVEEVKVIFAQGLDAAAESRAYFSQNTISSGSSLFEHAWAPTFDYAEGHSFAANVFAPYGQFIEGTGDDNDVFGVFEQTWSDNTSLMLDTNHGLLALDGDTIYDLDVGQNSLSLAVDDGEGIYFDVGTVDKTATTIAVNYDSVNNSYSADITLVGVGDTPDSASFTLADLNGPTRAFYGGAEGKEYKLAAVWNDVDYSSNSLEVGVGNQWTDSKTQLTELKFEWREVGEIVGGDTSDDIITGSNGANTIQARGGNDVLNGAGGADSYQFTGNFGMDKVLDYDIGGTYAQDTLHIGAAMQDVWFERLGRRGDELQITVNSTTSTGQINVARQFNPYTEIAAVEAVQFDFDGQTGSEIITLANGMYGGEINVLTEGVDNFHTHGDSDSFIYMNANEGAATISLISREYHEYGVDSAEELFNFEIDYGNHSDKFAVESYHSASMSEYGGMTSFISQNNVDLSGIAGHGLAVTQNGNAYEFRNSEGDDLTTLLFALEYIDATA